MVMVKTAAPETTNVRSVAVRPGQGAGTMPRTAARGIGNQALLRRLNTAPPGEQVPPGPAPGEQVRPSSARPIRRKPILTVPGDALEQEADAAADRVMRMEGSVPPLPPAPVTCPATVRRDDDTGDGLDGLDTAAAVRAAGHSGEPLPPALRADLEVRFGHDFRQVRVHADAEAAAAARGVHAKAYATGRDIVFAAGRYAPETTAGRRLIAHELAHVVQQGAASHDADGGAHHAAPAAMIARDADDDQIEAIEAEKLEIHALLDRCDALDPAQRDRMIGKIGGHAATTHEERQLACLLAAKFQGTMPRPDHVVMTRAEFYNTYHALLERLPTEQSNAVLDRVGTTVIGKTMYQGVLIDKRSINNVGMQGAPGSSIVVNDKTYVVVDDGVRFKTNNAGGPAKRNNNPGNISVDDNAPLAWSGEIGAYRGRNTEGRYAVFPSYERGRAGAIAWAKRHPSLTLLKYFEQYAPSSEAGNNPQTYADVVSASVTRATDGTATAATTIQQILTFSAKSGGKAPMEAFVDGQEVAEGFHLGVVQQVAKDDASLPQQVRDFVAGFDRKTGGTEAVAHDVATAAAGESKAAAEQKAADAKENQP